MASVWAVESGSYSDYHVVGVFSTSENAQRIADKISDASVVEWALDPAIAALNQGYDLFSLLMQKDGTVEHCDQRELSGYDLEGEVRIWRRSQAFAYEGRGIQDVLNAVVWAKDATHAIKITNEHRTRLIATGEWDAKEQA